MVTLDEKQDLGHCPRESGLLAWCWGTPQDTDYWPQAGWQVWTPSKSEAWQRPTAFTAPSPPGSWCCYLHQAYKKQAVLFLPGTQFSRSVMIFFLIIKVPHVDRNNFKQYSSALKKKPFNLLPSFLLHLCWTGCELFDFLLHRNAHHMSYCFILKKKFYIIPIILPFVFPSLNNMAWLSSQISIARPK